MSERTLLPVLITARDGAHLPSRLREGLVQVLQALSISPEDIDREAGTMQDFRFGKTRSRRVLGSMTDFAWMLESSR